MQAILVPGPIRQSIHVGSDKWRMAWVFCCQGNFITSFFTDCMKTMKNPEIHGIPQKSLDDTFLSLQFGCDSYQILAYFIMKCPSSAGCKKGFCLLRFMFKDYHQIAYLQKILLKAAWPNKTLINHHQTNRQFRKEAPGGSTFYLMHL